MSDRNQLLDEIRASGSPNPAAGTKRRLVKILVVLSKIARTRD